MERSRGRASPQADAGRRSVPPLPGPLWVSQCAFLIPVREFLLHGWPLLTATHAHPARSEALSRPRSHEGPNRGREPRHGLRSGDDDHDAQHHLDAGEHAGRLLSEEPHGGCVWDAEARAEIARGSHRPAARRGRGGGPRGGECHAGHPWRGRARHRAHPLPAGGPTGAAKPAFPPQRRPAPPGRAR